MHDCMNYVVIIIIAHVWRNGVPTRKCSLQLSQCWLELRLQKQMLNIFRYPYLLKQPEFSVTALLLLVDRIFRPLPPVYHLLSSGLSLVVTMLEVRIEPLDDAWRQFLDKQFYWGLLALATQHCWIDLRNLREESRADTLTVYFNIFFFMSVVVALFFCYIQPLAQVENYNSRNFIVSSLSRPLSLFALLRTKKNAH